MQFIDVECDLYQSAFSGEVVFAIKMFGGSVYEGIAPKHYVKIDGNLSNEPLAGHVQANLIKRSKDKMLVMLPDEGVVEIPCSMGGTSYDS